MQKKFRIWRSTGGVYIEVRPGMRNWYGQFFANKAALRISDTVLCSAAEIERSTAPAFREIACRDGFGRVALIICTRTCSLGLYAFVYQRQYGITLGPEEALEFAHQLWVAAYNNLE
jgi:hypothetical protein